MIGLRPISSEFARKQKCHNKKWHTSTWSKIQIAPTVKLHFYARVLFMRIMRGHSWSDKFVSHYIIIAHDVTCVHRSCARARLLRCLTPLQVAAMALLRYFQVTASLPTAEDTTLGDTATQSANAAVLREVQAERQITPLYNAHRNATKKNTQQHNSFRGF